jgi:SpoVK/Ycf46/Vps4 family AAA+-type ATPase
MHQTTQEAAVKNAIHDLGLVLDSRVRLILIESWDERRVLETLSALAIRRGLSLYNWTINDGLQHLGAPMAGVEDADTRDPQAALRLLRADPQEGLYVFCDLHPFIEDNPRLVRLLKDVALAEGNHRPTLILVSHAFRLPAEVQRHAARFDLQLPGEEELLAIVREEAVRWSESNQRIRVSTDSQSLRQVVRNLRGMSHAEARRLARTLICDDGAITQEDLPALNRAKFQLLDLDAVLSFEQDSAQFADVGGLENLKRWLNIRKQSFLDNGQTDSPKGILLTGVQGSGKSLAAKAVAGLWGLPLLRLDFASLYNKFFGETERNLREALHLAEQMAPCVLWMDEMEKGLASGDNDGGVSRRVLGTLLTWMAERNSPVFLVATANAIQRLPPELLRKGRFDELFFVDLPQTGVRAEIFRIHLRRRELDPGIFDLAALAAASAGFSGAEIEQAVVSSLYAAQARQQTVDQALLLHELQATVPLSQTMQEELTALRNWAAGRTVRAN